MAIEIKGSSAPALASNVTPPKGKTYGQNAPQPSSVPCSESSNRSALDISPPGEDALHLVQKGLHHPILSEDGNDWQTRQVSGNVADHPHMGRPNNSVRVDPTPARPVKS